MADTNKSFMVGDPMRATNFYTFTYNVLNKKQEARILSDVTSVDINEIHQQVRDYIMKNSKDVTKSSGKVKRAKRKYKI